MNEDLLEDSLRLGVWLRFLIGKDSASLKKYLSKAAGSLFVPLEIEKT